MKVNNDLERFANVRSIVGLIDWRLIVLIIFCCSVQMYFLSSPFVNLEYVYHQSAEFISYGSGLRDSLLNLFEGFNNPIGNVVLIAGAQNLFGVTEWSSRMPALLSWVICVSVVYVVCSIWWSSPLALISVSLVSVVPVFWVYGGTTYPDVPFTALITLAMFVAGYAIDKHSIKMHLLSALLISVASLIRYNGLLFLPVIFISAWIHSRNNKLENVIVYLLKVFVFYIGFVIIVLAPYFVWTRQVLGIVFRPEFVLISASDIKFHLIATIPRLGGYIMWLGALFVPFIPIILNYIRSSSSQSYKWVIVCIMPLNLGVVFLVQYLESFSGEAFGEMWFGWLERLLPFLVIQAMRLVFLLVGELCVFGIIKWGREKVWPNMYISLWLLIPLLIHSFYRMSQRYVMFFCIPLAIFLSLILYKSFINDAKKSLAIWSITIYMIIYSAVGIFTTIYYSTEGYAAADIAYTVNNNNYNIEASRHNPVLTNSAYLVDESRFSSNNNNQVSHRVVMLGIGETVDGIVYLREVRVLGILLKSYAIVKEVY